MGLAATIRNFIERDLRDVVAWSDVTVNDTTGDTTRATIKGKFGSYRLDVTSSYSAPPLGRVVLTDLDRDQVYDGNNQDGTWHQIALRIRKREGKEIVAPVVATPPKPASAVAVLTPANPIPAFPVVRFIANNGEWFHDGPALITKVNPDGALDLYVFPCGGEPYHRQSVAKQSEALKHCCWVDYAGAVLNVDHVVQVNYAALFEKISEQVAHLEATINEDRARRASEPSPPVTEALAGAPADKPATSKTSRRAAAGS